MINKNFLRMLALVAILALAGAACGGGDEPEPSGTGTTSAGAPTSTGSAEPTGSETPTTSPSATETTPPVEAGGTLKMILTSGLSGGMDPQKAYYNVTFEFLRCCLGRTLMGFPGTPDSQVQPDLAAGQPEVSADGLTWTFKLKPGIKYAPPLDNLTVTSKDIVRALEREACGECAAGGYNFYYYPIKGFQDFAAGKADTIEGLETPDDLTLVVTLTEPAGDLPFRLALPATAPIPPNPDAPKDRLGIAEGHDKEDFGLWVSSTGPYMIEGADKIDYSQGAKAKGASGWDPDKSLVLVRNPSWDPATDTLRPALVDKVDVEFSTASPEDIYAKIDRGEADWTDALEPTDILQKYASDPELQGQLHVTEGTVVRFIEINLAVPPFDDIHVRKALNLAIDREGTRKLRGGEIFGTIATHAIINSLTGGVLTDYDPYPAAGAGGDIEAAKAEMKQSKYDKDGDGVCDDPSCKNILAINDEGDPYPAQAKLWQQNFEPLGITLNVKAFDRGTMYGKCSDPQTHQGLCLAPGWGQDYPDAVTFGPPLFGKDAIGPEGCCNRSLLGASPELLKKFKYPVTEVPSVEADLKKCSATPPGDERTQCWADFDRHITEDVVPWIPYLFDNDVELVSSNVLNFTYDAFAGDISIDHVGIAPAA